MPKHPVIEKITGCFFVPKLGGYAMKEIQNANAVVPIDTPPVIGTIHSIPLSAIHPMPTNPFQIRDDPATYGRLP